MTATALPLSRPHPPRIARGGWLDLLRFVVGSLIILYHFREAAPVPLPDFHPVFDRGYLLTNFFIIDSGYVLARIYGDRFAAREVPLGAYARQRLWRVIPAHLMVIIALAALVAIAALMGISPSNPGWFDWSQLPAQVMLLQSYGVPGGRGWNAPTWTLSALIGCYLILPWLCRALWRVPPLLALTGSALLVVVANEACLLWLGDPLYRLPFRFGIVRALPLFLVGVAVAYVGARLYVPARTAGLVGVVAVLGLIAAQVIGDLALVSLALMTVIIWASGATPVETPSRLIEQLALMSFSMFLTNEVTRIVWFGMLDAGGQDDWPAYVRWWAWGLGLFGAFAVAAVFRYGFDRPVQALLKTNSGSRDGDRAPATVA